MLRGYWLDVLAETRKNKKGGFSKMPEPIDYMKAFPQVNIGERFLRGYQIGSGIRQIQEQEQAKQQAEQRLQSYRGELESAFTQGTPQAFSRLMTLFPEHQAAIKPQFDQLSKDRQAGEIAAALPVASALLSGNAKVAKDLIEARIKATPEGQDSSGLQTLSKLVDADPQAARNYALMGLSQVMAPDKFAETFGKLAEAGRDETMAPITMREKTAETIGKEISNKFAPDKFAADLGLTQAQTEQAKAAVVASKAAAAKSGADAALAQAEARQMGAGVIPLDKRPEAEAKFRKEYSDQTKGYQEVKSAYQRILSSEDSAVGDLSLIFGYMKMLDPGSVVREGEFATASAAAGVPTRILNLYNKVLSGERLSPGQRQSFKGQSEKLYKTAATQEQYVRNGIGRMATGYGLKTENIFYTPTEVAPVAPATVPAAAPTPAAPQPAQNRINQLLKQYGPQ
jgi:hypothetical protein